MTSLDHTMRAPACARPLAQYAAMCGAMGGAACVGAKSVRDFIRSARSRRLIT